VRGEVEPPDLPIEAVVDEPIGKVQEVVSPHRGDHSLGADAILEDAVEDGESPLVVVKRPGLDVRRRGGKGRAALATGARRAGGDVQGDGPLELDGADEPVVDVLAPPERSTRRTRGVAWGAVDGYRARVGTEGLQDLRARVGLVMRPQSTQALNPPVNTS
jgi:hypothetical protein